MLGAVIGDLAGSTREFEPVKRKDVDLLPEGSNLTDDSVLSVAVGVAILDDRPFADTIREYARACPTSYGLDFYTWALGDAPGPYGSWGNGSAMRVSPCAWLACDLVQAVHLARSSAEATHDHPEGVRGAVATVVAVYLARCGWDADRIRAETARISGYDLSATVDGIRPDYRFEVACAKSVPQALVCALESTSYEDAVRNAISLGGDADTQAAIAGAVAEPLHGGVPPTMADAAWERLRAWNLAPQAERILAASKPPREPGPAFLARVTFTDTLDDWRSRTGRPVPEPEPPPRERDWDRFFAAEARPAPERELRLPDRIGRALSGMFRRGR